MFDEHMYLTYDLGDDIPSWVKWQMEACQCDWRMCNWAMRIHLPIPTIIMTAGIAMVWQVVLMQSAVSTST